VHVPPRNPIHAAALREALDRLRDYAAAHEHGLDGIDAIVDYLTQLGVRNGLARPVTRWTVKNWIKRRGFPAFRAGGGRTWTTNLIVLAWLWSYREYRRTKGYRSCKLKDA